MWRNDCQYEEKQDKVDVGGGGQKIETGIGKGQFQQKIETSIGKGQFQEKVVDESVGKGQYIEPGKGIGGINNIGGYGGIKVNYIEGCYPGGPCLKPSGIFPDPKSCCSFVQCSHCKAYIQKCGPGTHFNPYKLVCDFPGSAYCKSADQ
ncbi:hypothetical protein B4U79_15813, partial [Dinothrombium tinctorium]